MTNGERALGATRKQDGSNLLLIEDQQTANRS